MFLFCDSFSKNIPALNKIRFCLSVLKPMLKEAQCVFVPVCVNDFIGIPDASLSVPKNKKRPTQESKNTKGETGAVLQLRVS